jgi:hypothetical protein
MKIAPKIAMKAYVATYTSRESVGGEPDKDYAIGVAHKVVGCGLRIKTRPVTWLTIIKGRLIYNGLLGEQVDENPWATAAAAEGKKTVKAWNTYRVPYHHDLGELNTVLTAVGVDRSVIPRTQNRWVSNMAAFQAVIDYAEAFVSEIVTVSKSEIVVAEVTASENAALKAELCDARQRSLAADAEIAALKAEIAALKAPPLP